MKVYFGGPDKPAYLLRDLLASKIDEIDGHGEIFWMTYYFRDIYLAEKLIEAANRGVKISIVLDAKPRVKSANDEVYSLLKKSGNIDIVYVRHKTPHKHISRKMPKIHEKLYYFRTQNKAFAYVGSFNPSGRINDDIKMIELIGDQDRGHNFLIEINDAQLLDELYEHCIYIKNIKHWFCEILKKGKNRICNNNIDIYFSPWASKKAVMSFLNSAERGDKLLIAMSHFSSIIIIKKLIDLSRRGVQIQIISHDTKRRFPETIERILRTMGIECHRYVHPKGYPMHNKFMILEKKHEGLLACGSLNLTARSLNENHELLLISKVKSLLDRFKKRWNEIYREIVENKYCDEQG